MTPDEKLRLLDTCETVWNWVFRASLQYSMLEADKKVTGWLARGWKGDDWEAATARVTELEWEPAIVKEVAESMRRMAVVRTKVNHLWARLPQEQTRNEVARRELVEQIGFAEGLGQMPRDEADGAVGAVKQCLQGVGNANDALGRTALPIQTDVLRLQALHAVLRWPDVPLWCSLFDWAEYEEDAKRYRAKMETGFKDARSHFEAEQAAAPEATAPNPPAPQRRRRTRDEAARLAGEALSLLCDHPDWPQAEIARELKISRTYLQGMPVFAAAWRREHKGKAAGLIRRHNVRDKSGRWVPRI